MMMRVAASGAICLSVGTTLSAHRLDDYLQATSISVEKDRVHAQIRLTPGVAVLPIVLATIDTDADGVISEIERRAYSERVLRDLSVTIDGARLPLRVASSIAAGMREMKEGRGDIVIEVDADVPPGGPTRRLEFENHHQARIAAYLVNCLVPGDPDIAITTQNRNYEQSSYRLDYVETGGRGGPLSLARWPTVAGWSGAAALVLFGRFALRGRRRTRATNVAIEHG